MFLRRWTLAFYVLAILVFSGFGASAQLTANFTSNVTSGCSPLIVQFTDVSTGPNPIISWSWSFGNGNFSNQKNPGAIYIAPGVKTVTLIVFDGTTRDTIIRPNYITVFQDPTVNASVDVTQGCVPVLVHFTDNSTPGSAPITTWIWDFGDGLTSLVQNPTHTYTNPGCFTVTLSLIDANGCRKNRSYTNMVCAGSVPIPGFGSDVNSSCVPPLTVNFTDSSTGTSALNYFWNFGDGGTSTAKNPPHTYLSLGTFDVKLRVTDVIGCKDSITIVDYVAIEDLVADFTSNVVQGCVGQAVQFTDVSTSNPNSWVWVFGDGDSSTVNNPLHTYTTSGTFTVSLIAANSGSCADTVQKLNYITIHPSPVSNFTADILQSCSAPLNVNFSDLSANAVSWQWTFGDGGTSTSQNPSHAYLTIDSFTVTLVVGNVDNCYDTIVKTNFIRISPPQVAFDAQNRYGCIPLDVQFADSSTSINTIIGWLWDFGDGFSSTFQNPSHTYNVPGQYHVTLTVFDSDGCSSTLVDSNFVGAGVVPTTDFYATPLVACIFLPVNFFNNSTNSNSWHWEFGDGGISDEFEPQHTYGDTGYFTVTLIARDNGCPDTLTLVDYVYVSPPDAIFTVAFDCSDPLTVSFIDGSLAPDTWDWDFGDGSPHSSTPSPSHTYAIPGTYHVILTCTNIASGCTDIQEQDIVVTSPTADFIGAPTFGCSPHVVNFTDNSVDAVSWTWLSNGQTTTARNPGYTYSSPGIYDVRLIITDAHGCKDTMNKTQYVTVAGPTANFNTNPTTGCAPLNVNFTDASTPYLSPIVSWSWNFGDGGTSTLQNPTHVFSTVGFYNANVVVRDSNGCTNAITKINLIQPTFPAPDFSADTQSCTTLGVQFVNSSVGVGMTFLWNFGDSTFSTSTNPKHFYANEGTYTVSLTATDANGCDSTLTIPNYVRIANPSANFVADNLFAPCPPLLVNFIDSSSDATSWYWTFGDGASSTLPTPSHVYTAPGIYDVQLVVTSSLGCKDTLLRNDYIKVLGPNGTFDFDPRFGCIPQQICFNAVTFNTADRTWDFGDGTLYNGPLQGAIDTTLHSATDTICHIFNTPGIYHPTIILDDGLGCIFALTSADSLIIGDITPDLAASEVKPCPYEAVQFTDLSASFPPVMSWKWRFGDGDSSTFQNPTHAYDTSGYFNVSLVVFNGVCYDTVSKPNYIYVTPFPQANFTMSATSGCENVNVIFNETAVTDTAISVWDWDFDDGTFDSIQSPTHSFPTGTYHVKLVATSLKGCSDSVSRTITVYPNPTASAGPDSTVCRGIPVQLNGSGGLLYQWSPALGLNNDSISNPIATPSDTTEYILTVTDIHGCQDTDSTIVNIKPTPFAIAMNDVEICIGNSVEINASGGALYAWTPNADLSCDSCPNPIATPNVTTRYVVTVTNGIGCSDTADVLVTIRPRPTGIITPDSDICIGDTVQIETQGGAVYFWNADSSLSCTACANPVANPTTTTLYSVVMYNVYSCEKTDSITVTVHQVPVLTIQTNPICQGDTGQIISSGAAVYNWTPPGGLSCDNCPNPLTYPDTTTTYLLQAFSSFACVKYDSVTVIVLPDPVVQTIEDATICLGEEIELTTTYVNTDSIKWGPVNGIKSDNIPSPTAKPTTTTQYTVTAVNNAGCSSTDDVTISVITRVDATISGDAEICYGESVQLEGEIISEGMMGSNVVWSPVTDMDNPTSLSPTVQPGQTITYTMVVTSGSCIPDTNSVTITVHPLPTVDLASPVKVLQDTRLTLAPITTANVAQYTWEFNTALSCLDCENPVATIGTAPEHFRVTIADVNGCTAEDSMDVLLIGTCADNIFVAEAFSPNGDEKNDKLYVRGLLSEMKYFRVFDRWGNLVFQTTDATEGWDGIYHGKKMNPAVFVYSVEGTCANGQAVFKKGNVTLIR